MIWLRFGDDVDDALISIPGKSVVLQGNLRRKEVKGKGNLKSRRKSWERGRSQREGGGGGGGKIGGKGRERERERRDERKRRTLRVVRMLLVPVLSAREGGTLVSITERA